LGKKFAEKTPSERDLQRRDGKPVPKKTLTASKKSDIGRPPDTPLRADKVPLAVRPASRCRD